MALGGHREGAGRPAGRPNKRTAEILEKVEAAGLSPLDYMLSVLWDEEADPKDRMWAAEKSAPYVHSKLASIDVKGHLSVSSITKEQRDAAVAAAMRADT